MLRENDVSNQMDSTQFSPQILQAMQSVQAATVAAEADPLRPIFHFLPPANWMNDPNGPILHDGWYHLFYQHNPFGDEWGFMHWGHARSRNLVHWEHLPIALAPSYEAGEEHVFSGCARINGLGEPLLLYTSVKQGTRENRAANEQWAARPLDAEWLTWEKHPANPVLALETHGGPPYLGDWRDPFIFSAEGRNFLVLGAETQTEGEVALYEALDNSLLRWRYCGPLVKEKRVKGRFLECPNFALIAPSQPGSQAKWLLLTSPYNLVEYTSGAFDAQSLTFTPEQHGILDSGRGETPNFYATNLVEDPTGNTVLLGWVRGFEKGHGWNGTLALPRLLTVAADGRPCQQPLPALHALRGEQQSAAALDIAAGSQVLPDIAGNTLEIELALQLGTADSAGVRLCTDSAGQGGVEVRWDGATLTVAGSQVDLPADPARELDLHIFLDRCILEVFADGGRVAVTRIVYPQAGDQALSLFAEGGAAHVVRLDAWRMKGIYIGH